jgi:hypothetical protein
LLFVRRPRRLVGFATLEKWKTPPAPRAIATTSSSERRSRTSGWPRRVRASGETLVVKAPEDTVLRKLLWFREGGGVSEKQWRDVIEVLRVSAEDIDAAYLSCWANRLGLRELLAKARADAG